MPRLEEERIAAMFAEFGLATEEERRRFTELAHVGVVEVVRDRHITIVCATDTPEFVSGDGQDAELP